MKVHICLLIMSLLNLFALFCIILPQIHSNPGCNVCSCMFDQLNCNSNPGTEIPLVWPNYTSQYVTRIRFLNTNIRVLRRDNFISFPSLVEIVIQNSELSEIEEGAFNEVASILTSIDFTNNKLNMVNPRWFLNMTSLTDLVLTNNKIEFVLPNSFPDLTNLEKLYLNNNQIKRISIGNLDIFNNSALTDVKLGSNPFVCDCYLIWLQQELMDMPIKFTDFEQVKCEYPSNVTGEEVAITFPPPTYCLNLCLDVNCTENSSCTIENNFPTCGCESGFDPIGNGTYECTSVPIASTTIISSSMPSTDITNTLGPIMTTTDIPTHSTTVTLITNTLGPIISTTVTSNLTLSTIASSFSSHLVTPTMTPNNTNNFQTNLLIPISFAVILAFIGIFIGCVIAVAVALRIKKSQQVETDQSIPMTDIGPTMPETHVIVNPLFVIGDEAPEHRMEDQVAPT